MTDLYAYSPSRIVMDSTQNCSHCSRAKAFFEANDIPYLHIVLEGNSKATEFVIGMNNGYQSVPTIVFPDGTALVEPSWQELKDKLSQ